MSQLTILALLTATLNAVQPGQPLADQDRPQLIKDLVTAANSIPHQCWEPVDPATNYYGPEGTPLDVVLQAPPAYTGQPMRQMIVRNVLVRYVNGDYTRPVYCYQAPRALIQDPLYDDAEYLDVAIERDGWRVSHIAQHITLPQPILLPGDPSNEL